MAGLVCVSMTGCANSIPEQGKVTDEQGQPVAGVHVLVWRLTTTRSIIPFGSSISSSSCGPEHYTVSAADGTFVIPDEVLAQSRWATTTYFQIAAHKKGMTAEYKSGAKQRPSQVSRASDEAPAKEEAFYVDVKLRPDTRGALEQYFYLGDLAKGSCSCSLFSRQLIADRKTIFVPPPTMLIGSTALDSSSCFKKD